MFKFKTVLQKRPIPAVADSGYAASWRARLASKSAIIQTNSASHAAAATPFLWAATPKVSSRP